MITIKSPREIETMAAAGRIVAGTLALVERHVRPGTSTDALDRLAEEFIRSHPGARPSFKGLYDFPATLCTSINHEIVHGIPSPKRVLKQGDLLSVDVGAWLEGIGPAPPRVAASPATAVTTDPWRSQKNRSSTLRGFARSRVAVRTFVSTQLPPL